MPSLREQVEAGCDLRVWCFRCNRGNKIAVTPEVVEKLIGKLVCGQCNGRDELLFLPATTDFRPSNNAMEELVAGIFHHFRSAAKKRRRRD